MRPHRTFVSAFAASAIGVVLAGCLFKPTTVATRSFVLTPLPPAVTNAVSAPLAVGISLVKIPAYLLRSTIAYRKSSTEIGYLEDSLWAEPLDQSFQRALGGNLAVLLPTDQIRLSAWQRSQVDVEVQINVERFDVDVQGQGTLIAWWRIGSSGGDQVLRSGRSHLTRNASATGVEAWVKAMNELTAEFSQVLVQAIQHAAPAAAAHKDR